MLRYFQNPKVFHAPDEHRLATFCCRGVSNAGLLIPVMGGWAEVDGDCVAPMPGNVRRVCRRWPVAAGRGVFPPRIPASWPVARRAMSGVESPATTAANIAAPRAEWSLSSTRIFCPR